MKRLILPFLFCIAFGDPNAVLWFVNYDLQPPRKYSIVTNHGQYQIFYQADEQVPTFVCPPNADCAWVPQECR